MANKTNVELKNGGKHLYVWAEELLFSDEVSNFLSRCKNEEGKEPTDVMTYTEFLTLKEKIENQRWILGNQKLARNSLPAFYYVLIFVVYIINVQEWLKTKQLWKIKKRTLMKKHLKDGLIKNSLTQKRLKNFFGIVKMNFVFLAQKWWQSNVLWDY